MSRRIALLLVAFVLPALLVAIPVLGADPAPSGGPAKAQKPKVEKTPVTLSGTVGATTDASGGTAYTLQSGGTTYTLDAGPSWFLGDKHPLKGLVGRSVTITGMKAANSAEVDVKTVNGTAVRGEGKPPWAGGWKRVGSAHPGWSQEKADRFKAKFGGCFPPGQCKEKPTGASSEGSTRPAATPTPTPNPTPTPTPAASPTPTPAATPTPTPNPTPNPTPSPEPTPTPTP